MILCVNIFLRWWSSILTHSLHEYFITPVVIITYLRFQHDILRKYFIAAVPIITYLQHDSLRECFIALAALPEMPIAEIGNPVQAADHPLPKERANEYPMFISS